MGRGINKLSARTIATAKEPGLYGDGANLYLHVADLDGGMEAWQAGGRQPEVRQRVLG